MPTTVERELQERLARAAQRVRQWFQSRVDDQALDIARLYQSERSRLTYRLRQVYDAYLADDPSILRARTTPAGLALDQSINETVSSLTNELGTLALTHLVDLHDNHPRVVNRWLSQTTGLPFEELPADTQTVLGELTQRVVGGGTFMDRMFNQSEHLRNDLTGTIRQALINGDDFDTLRKRIHKAFGVDKLAEPEGPAYGSVKIYQNEARREWNLLMGEKAEETGGVEYWWATVEGPLAATSTPGCVARHARKISELGGDRPPRHYNSITGDTFVAGQFVAATRMLYAGQIRKIKTAQGHTLTITPNHPVLTAAGMKSAGQVQKGDYLVAHRGWVPDEVSSGGLASVLPQNAQHGPARIEEVFETLARQGVRSTVRRLGVEFHGDAQYGQGDIDVVAANGALLDYFVERERAQHVSHFALEPPVIASWLTAYHDRGGDPLVVDQRVARAAAAVGQAGFLRRGVPSVLPSEPCRLGATAQLDAAISESLPESLVRDAFFVRQLATRAPSEVLFDPVVEIWDLVFHGPVYDLQSVSGIIVADGLLISNCRCTIVVVQRGEDPTEELAKADVWLAAHGFRRRQAVYMEAADFDPAEAKEFYQRLGFQHKSGTNRMFIRLGKREAATFAEAWDEEKHPRDEEGQFTSVGAAFKRAGDTVDGRKVRSEVPNRGSIAASLEDYDILSGVREVPFSAFTQMGALRYASATEKARTQRLADQIKQSGEISPLIVVMDKEGPYVLEGGHRFDALRELKARSFPALVVVDNTSLSEAWDPGEHPRDERSGEFTDKGGGSLKPSPEYIRTLRAELRKTPLERMDQSASDLAYRSEDSLTYAMAEQIEKASSREAMLQAMRSHATWSGDYLGDSHNWVAAQAFGAQGSKPKLVSLKLKLDEPTLAAFKARTKFVQDWARREYGDKITVYRGVKGEQARDLEQTKGREVELKTHMLASFTTLRSKAEAFAGKNGIVLETTITPDEVFIANDLGTKPIQRFSDDRGELVVMGKGLTRKAKIARGAYRFGKYERPYEEAVAAPTVDLTGDEDAWHQAVRKKIMVRATLVEVDWDPAEHPRDEEGQFASTGGVGGEKPWIKGGSDVGEIYHGGAEKIRKVDPEKLQRRDYGYYGSGFYVTSSKKGAKAYGRVVTKGRISPDAKVLDVTAGTKRGSGLIPKEVHPKLLDEVYNHLHDKGIERARARGKEDDFLKDLDLMKTSPIEWKNAVDRYAVDHGFDVVRYGGEIVVKNPNVFVFKEGWAWGTEQLVPLYRARVTAHPGHRYLSVSWRELPALAAHVMTPHALYNTPSEAQEAGAPDHVLLRTRGGSWEALAETGWRPLAPKHGTWVETSAGLALDSPNAPKWTEEAVRLSADLIERWPAMKAVTFPVGKTYRARVGGPDEAAVWTLGSAGPWTWPSTTVAPSLDEAVRQALGAAAPPISNPHLAVSVGSRDEPPTVIVQLDTGTILHARDPFPADLQAPYRRVAVLAPEPLGVWAVRPRGRSFWTLPGGHIKPGEAPVEAAAREMAEETGAQVRILRSLGRLYTPWATTEVFLARRVGKLQPPVTLDEIDASQVVPPDWLVVNERVLVLHHVQALPRSIGNAP